MSQPDSATVIDQKTAKDSSESALSHQVVLQTLIPGEAQLFPVSDVILLLPNPNQIDLTTRMADNPTHIRTPGVAELDKKGRLHIFNVSELADQLRLIPLNINDRIELFLPSDPKDRHVLRFALDHYYRALHGRAKYDAAPFLRLCFVSKGSADPSGLDQGLSFRLWIKANPKPFSKEEFLKRFPFSSSRWSHIRSLKTDLRLTVPSKPVDKQSNDTNRVLQNETRKTETDNAVEHVVHEPLPDQPHDGVEPQSEAETSASVSQSLSDYDLNSTPIDNRPESDKTLFEAAAETQSNQNENQVDSLFYTLLADTQYEKAKALWQQGLNSLRESGTLRKNLAPESWDWLCAFIAIAAADDESLRKGITSLTSRFIARENNYSPPNLVTKFAEFISNNSQRRFDEADIPGAVNSVLNHHRGGTRHG